MPENDRLPWEGEPGEQGASPATATADDAETLSVSQRTALEARAGLESLEEMQQKRRDLLKELAPLAAMHGPFGMWDSHRRQLRGVIGTEIRANWADAKPPSEAVVEDRACADARYQAALDRGLGEKIRYIELENQVTELVERIRSREFELAAYNAELRLAR